MEAFSSAIPVQQQNLWPPARAYLPMPQPSHLLRPSDFQQALVHRNQLHIPPHSWHAHVQPLHIDMEHNHSRAEGSPSQAMILVPEIHIQQAEAKVAEQNYKLRSENEAFSTEIANLKEALKMKKALLDEALLESKNKIRNLEQELLETAASEAEALFDLERTKESLEKQQESQREDEKCLVRVTEENHRLTAVLTEKQLELENQRKQWQEERCRVFQSLNNIQYYLQEREKSRKARMLDIEKKISRVESGLKKKKPRKLTPWKKITQLFK